MPQEENIISKYVHNRNFKLLNFFAVSTVLSVASIIAAKRAIAARKYMPMYFQSNYLPPPFSVKSDAFKAIGYATVIALSTFTSVTTGVCLAMDVRNASEFANKMKIFFGGDIAEQERNKIPIDKESLHVQESLENLLSDFKNRDK